MRGENTVDTITVNIQIDRLMCTLKLGESEDICNIGNMLKIRVIIRLAFSMLIDKI